MENKKITVRTFTRQFSKALSMLGAAINPNPIVPVTSHILLTIDPEENKLEMRATDFGITLKTYVDLQGFDVAGSENSFLIPYEMANRLMKSLPDSPMVINFFHDVAEDEKGRVVNDVFNVQFFVDGQEFCVPTYSAKEFPKMIVDFKETFDISQNLMKEGIGYIRNVIPNKTAGNNGMLHEAFFGMFIQITNGKIRLMASDRKQLGYFTAAVDSKLEEYVNVPPKAMNFLYDNMDNSETDVTLAISKNAFYAMHDDWSMATSISTEIFDMLYDKISQAEAEKEIYMNSQDWKTVIQRANMLADVTDAFIVHAFRDDKLFINSEDKLRSTKSEQFMAIEEGDHEFTVTLNGKNVANVLKAVSGPIKFCTLKGYPGIRLHVEQIVGDELLYILMPIVNN